MNRNKNIELIDVSKFIATIASKENIADFLSEILTKSEIETLSKRWRIIKMLNDKKTQREVAQELKVSLCKVTRGARILKNKNSIITNYLQKEKLYENQ